MCCEHRWRAKASARAGAGRLEGSSSGGRIREQPRDGLLWLEGKFAKWWRYGVTCGAHVATSPVQALRIACGRVSCEGAKSTAAGPAIKWRRRSAKVAGWNCGARQKESINSAVGSGSRGRRLSWPEGLQDGVDLRLLHAVALQNIASILRQAAVAPEILQYHAFVCEGARDGHARFLEAELEFHHNSHQLLQLLFVGATTSGCGSRIWQGGQRERREQGGRMGRGSL